MTDRFEEVFDLGDYKVILRNNAIAFEKDGNTYPLPGHFENEYDEFGIIVVKNIYIRLQCSEYRQRKQMFDFLARGFSIPIFGTVVSCG